MKIKIVKSSKPSYWYCAYVGIVFDCLEKGSPEDLQSQDCPDMYKVWVDENRDVRGYVAHEDAVVVEPDVTDALIEKMVDDFVAKTLIARKNPVVRGIYRQGLLDMKKILIKSWKLSEVSGQS